MFSCLGRLGCLLLVAIVAAVGWFTRDSWYPKLRARIVAAPPPVAAATWEPLTAEGAARGREAFSKLLSKDGPVFVNLSAGDFASFVLDEVVHGLSPSATRVEALARDDRLYLRSQVSIADLGGPQALGPLTGVLEGKQEITVRGRVEVVRPGHAQFRIDQVTLKDLKLPAALVERLVSRIAVANREAATPADAVPVAVARELADVRVGKGRVTLYKNVP